MAQSEMILLHLQKHGHITTLEAFKYYGITRLASRIFDLQQLGYKFNKKDIKHGVGHPYTEYSLKEDKANE